MQSMGDSYASLVSRSGDKPVQCIYWPDAFDQHLASKLTRGMKVDVGVEMRDGRAEENSSVGLRDSSGNELNGIGGLGKTFQAAGERLQSLRVPQAVVAFAQAAVKVNDLPGWPLLSPAKVQMQKCEKCSQEFYSPLNYRRHIRIHRRSLHANKEDFRKEKTRILAFWNKLTLETAFQILSIKNTMIEDLSGMATVRALTALIQQPRLSLLPQTFIKSGTALLDILQGKGLAHPIPADELFSILDDASENTFLCGGTSASVQRFVYRGEAGQLGLEDRNLVASLAFLMEQKLVNAWMIDKDTEALRCQKELVEEEEAAQKRRQKILEKKRQKKLRQKEKEKKEGLLQLLFHDQENDLIDDDSILRLEEEGDSPFGSGSSSMSLASSKKDLNRTETSDLQMAQFVAQLEENILLKSMHTFDQLVRSASEEELRDEEPQMSIGYILPSQEESGFELVDKLSNMKHKSEHSPTLETAVPLHNDRVDQEMFPALFQGEDEIIQSESNNTWKHSKSLRYQKSVSSKQKAGNNSQERIRFEQVEFSLQTMRNFTDANSTERENLGQVMNKVSSSKSLFTNGMKGEQSVSVTTAESNSLLPKFQQYNSKLSEQSRASANVLSGNAVWTKKTRLSSSVDQSKNIEESTAITPTSDGRKDSLDIASFQTLPAETLKTNKIICPSLASNHNVSLPLSGALSSSSYKPSDSNEVHETGCTSRRTLQCLNPQPYVLNEEVISGITTSQDPSNLSVGPDVSVEKSRVLNTSNVGENGLSHIHNTFEPVGSFGNELLIGSLKVPLNTFVADTVAHEDAQVMAREAKIAQEWCKKKDDNFYTKCLDQRWLSISDLAVAAFLSQRWNLAIKALEAAVSSA
ncbi:hypothetical protein O6H91_22G064400 [Diphasiastrum complanatum]|uniref:Uncharacterized protein n=4 Tax=Diphasiastrum complanatum TaxID=34168 RepID=A0ACC2AGB8_DIPCM|nr:hypothetical protein O6H91_22G064400 [Diphasiastrum complanatum]KAJ7516612.1 hypothetical protein O6H91_22G064400 [Diphasiastrum complanatum]KAJ7516613.1 hypothetical protein O6H91_22G064400 [Diphasiastrum complanatum]KAJ7516615.1 hypothetical protein O6H91_22G064400 [Diphasiastrum complanatum]